MNGKLTIYQVDAFTDEIFKGNPAGVCILPEEPSEQWMQNIAMEMNLSETAFVYPGTNGARIIRFFTPEAEVPLCGHATLAASHIMFNTGESGQLVLESASGKLIVTRKEDWITMNFPADTLTETDNHTDFVRVTGFKPLRLYETGNFWTLAILEDEKQLRSLEPDIAKMKHSKYGDLIVTAPSDDKAFDYSVRCFAPAVGINEDPVTGSAQCALVPYWSMTTGRKSFSCRQVSKRGGVLKVELSGDRVNISGQAVTVFRAELSE